MSSNQAAIPSRNNDRPTVVYDEISLPRPLFPVGTVFYPLFAREMESLGEVSLSTYVCIVY